MEGVPGVSTVADKCFPRNGMVLKPQILKGNVGLAMQVRSHLLKIMTLVPMINVIVVMMLQYVMR